MKAATADRRLIVAFCILAAIRVFIYAAAFPFFNNVDEQAHFDLVMRYYGQGHIPRSPAQRSVRAGAQKQIPISFSPPPKAQPGGRPASRVGLQNGRSCPTLCRTRPGTRGFAPGFA